MCGECSKELELGRREVNTFVGAGHTSPLQVVIAGFVLVASF